MNLNWLNWYQRTVESVRDAFVGKEEQGLRFSEISDHLFTLPWLKNMNPESRKKNVQRYVKRFLGERFLVKKDGKYFLSSRKEDYRIFSYLDDLRDRYVKGTEKCLSNDFCAEATGWGLCAGTMIPMFDMDSLEAEEEFVAKQMAKTLAWLFDALKDLRNIVFLRRAGIPIAMTDTTLRWTLFCALVNELDEGSNKMTHELVSDLSPMVKRTIPMVEKIIESNRKYDDDIGEDLYDGLAFFLSRSGHVSADELRVELTEQKEFLKSKHSLDVDKFSTDEVIEKLQKFDSNLEQAGGEIRSEDSEQLFALQRAAEIKAVQYFADLDMDWEDFAITLTPLPSTMRRYHTPATVLRDEIQNWQQICPIDDELLRYFAAKLLRFRPDEIERLNKEKRWRARMFGVSRKEMDDLFKHYHELLNQWRKSGEMPKVQVSGEKETKQLLNLTNELKQSRS